MSDSKIGKIKAFQSIALNNYSILTDNGQFANLDLSLYFRQNLADGNCVKIVFGEARFLPNLFWTDHT